MESRVCIATESGGNFGRLSVSPDCIPSLPRLRSFQVDAVDTTGAGDCFVGGFLAALSRGAAYPEAARFANAVGALSVQKLGATNGVRTRAETEEWLRTALLRRL